MIVGPNSTLEVPRRILVIGNSGSGKTTFAKSLASRLGVAHIEGDSHFHQANWTQTASDDFREIIDRLTETNSWVMDGNYYQYLHDVTWPKADAIIWLDYNLILVLWRVLKRTAVRVIARTELWNGNRESLRMAFSRDSIILWSLNMHYVYRARYEKLLSLPSKPDRLVIHLKSPTEAEAWIKQLG